MPRLDSKLSRLLLDSGRLAVGHLEEAAQQQVIHGGALDTLLLELGLVDEATISEALAEAWATEAIEAKAIQLPDGQAGSWIPERMAVRMALCPFREEAGALHVLVAAPIDHELLDEVGQLTGKTLVPHVVPEVRLLSTLGRLYDVPVEERFVSLLAHLDQGLEGPIRAPHDDEAQADVERSEWDLVEALANLAAQDNRQGISRVALQFARQYLPFAAIFGVRGDQAVGWSRSGGTGAQFGRVPLPVPEGSVLRQVLDSPSPLLGKPPIGPGNQAFLGWLGRRRPRTALLVPIIVARRTVALLYADGGVRARNYDELSDLVAFGARLGPAFEALLRVRHRENEALFGPRSEELTDPYQSVPSSSPPIKQDGTSPFARGYKREVTAPPEKRVAATLKMDGDGQWSMVIEPTDEKASAPAAPAAAKAATTADLHGWGDAVADENDDATDYADGGVSPGGVSGETQDLDGLDTAFAEEPPSEFEGFDDGTLEQATRLAAELGGLTEELGPAGAGPVANAPELDLDSNLDSGDTLDSELTAPYGSEVPTEDGDPTGPSARATPEPDIDWDNDEEEENITFDGTLVDEPAVPATLDDALLKPAAPAGGAAAQRNRPSFAPLGAKLGLDRSHSLNDGPGEAVVGASAYEPDDLEPEEDVTYDDEVTGMFPVGVVSAEDRDKYNAVVDDLEQAESQLQEDETGGFRNLLASVKDDLSGPNPAVPTRNIDVSGLTAAQREAGAKAFGSVSDEGAAEDWTGALHGAAAKGPASDGSGPVLVQSDGWDDVVLDAALKKAAEESSVDLNVGELPPDEPAAVAKTDTSSPAAAKQPVVKGQLEILDAPAAAADEPSEPIALTKPKLSPDDVLRMPASPSLSPLGEAAGAPAMTPADAEVTLHTGDVEVASAEDVGPGRNIDLGHLDVELGTSGLELDTTRESLASERVLGDAADQAAPAKPVEPDLTIDDAAEMLESSYKARVREAQAFLAKQGQAAIPALAGRFPGRLLVDPFASESVLTATGGDLGPLMELLQSMGQLGLEAAIPHLDAPQPGHRFCATFLFKLVPDERCLDLLKKRLHDHEPNIRLAAAAAMDEFIAHPRFAHVLQHLRDRLTSPSPEAQERAIVLLGQFSDVGSVPSLIDLLDDSHAAVRSAAHVALCDICLVNNGKKARAWTKWWEKARKRSRVDWVIDALRSKDESVRRVARVELTNLTGGDDFGFEPIASKRDRERAVRAVEQWWDEQRASLSA